MMIKRCLRYLGLMLTGCLLSFTAQAEERIAYVTAMTFGETGSPHAESVKLTLALSQWRTGSEPSDAPIASNLIALSNHYGLTGAAPFSVPDWEDKLAA